MALTVEAFASELFNYRCWNCLNIGTGKFEFYLLQ